MMCNGVQSILLCAETVPVEYEYGHEVCVGWVAVGLVVSVHGIQCTLYTRSSPPPPENCSEIASSAI